MGMTGSSLLCNRVRIYHRSPDMVLAEGAILLPFGDDMRVPTSLDFSNQEDTYQEDGLPDSSNVSIAQDDQATRSSTEIMQNDNGHIDGSDYHKLITIRDIYETSTSLASAGNGNGTVDVNPESSMSGFTRPVQRFRVRLFPRKSGIVLPEGDDKDETST